MSVPDKARVPTDEEISTLICEKFLGWRYVAYAYINGWYKTKVFRPPSFSMEGERGIRWATDERPLPSYLTPPSWHQHVPKLCSEECPHIMVRYVVDSVYGRGNGSVYQLTRLISLHSESEEYKTIDILLMSPKQIMTAALRACGFWPEEWEF